MKHSETIVAINGVTITGLIKGPHAVTVTDTKDEKPSTHNKKQVLLTLKLLASSPSVEFLSILYQQTKKGEPLKIEGLVMDTTKGCHWELKDGLFIFFTFYHIKNKPSIAQFIFSSFKKGVK